VANRAYDLCDVFQVGVGVTAENPKTGMLPPALGVHVQATDFVNLGALHFSGLIADWDGRGLFAGHEDRTRLGFLPFQTLKLDQDYSAGWENYFKKVDSSWTDRMNSTAMRFADSPAKELEYVFWADQLHQGAPLFYRGWQYWENVGAEVGVCEPFVTHLGVYVRLGFDLSEVMDFGLGILYIDFKRDDMTREEFREMTGRLSPETEHSAATKRKPASDEPVPPALSPK
jgi:hypothetical protein